MKVRDGIRTNYLLGPWRYRALLNVYLFLIFSILFDTKNVLLPCIIWGY